MTTEPTITILDSPDWLFYLSLSHLAKRYPIVAGTPRAFTTLAMSFGG